ncbi:hypothetical protein, partial [Roseivivax sp. CAU 1753]
MSTIEKVGTQAGATCVGAIAVALGDPAGASLAATGALGLMAIALSERLGSVDRACTRGKAAAMAALETSGDFRDMNLTRVEALLAIDASALSRDDLIATSRAQDTAEAMAALLVARVAFDGDSPADRMAVRLALDAAMQACEKSPDFRTELRDVRLADVQAEVLTLRQTTATKTDLSAMEARMLAAIDAQGSDSPARKMLKEREKLVMALAERYAEGSPDDFDSAMRGLEHALDIAATRAPGGNLDAEIGAIMAEVDRLNDAGDIEAGVAALSRARAEMRDDEQRRAAAYLAVLDRSVDQAVLARDVSGAAELVTEKIARETPDPAARFAALRKAQDAWYVAGRDKGLRFDLEVSIALARSQLLQAKDADQKGATQNDLGIALQTLGARESGTARLEEAVTAYRDALQEVTRDRVPLDWAGTQNNLGNALRTLGARESGTARLEEAVIAYRDALQERTRDRVPLDWAMTQNNLGNALQT